MLLIDGNGTPCGNMIESASPHEVNLVEPLIANRVIRRRPKKLIYDKAADSDPLRFRLLKRGSTSLLLTKAIEQNHPLKTVEN